MKARIRIKTTDPHASLLGHLRKKHFFSDNTLVGHVMETTPVEDEFQCQLKCMGNDSCKSINLHPIDRNKTRLCELNKQTRQIKTNDLKPMKGFTYFGSVQVSR